MLYHLNGYKILIYWSQHLTSDVWKRYVLLEGRKKGCTFATYSIKGGRLRLQSNIEQLLIGLTHHRRNPLTGLLTVWGSFIIRLKIYNRSNTNALINVSNVFTIKGSQSKGVENTGSKATKRVVSLKLTFVSLIKYANLLI